MSKKPTNKNPKVQDQSTAKIYIIYKKKCQLNGISICNLIKQKLQQATQHGILQTFQTFQQLGPNQSRFFIESLQQLKYKHLKQLRLWKAQVGDQGVRIISKYLLNPNELKTLDLLDNGVTSLGCQFLGKCLVNKQIKIKNLQLDNNNIGSQGVKNLAVGLRTIDTLEKLSLKYCNITKQGVKYLQQIIANINSKLISLNLTGNPFQNQGTYQLLRALKNCGQSLQRVFIADIKMNLLNYNNQIFDSIEMKIKQQFLGIIKNNLLMSTFDIRFNQLHDQIAIQMLEAVENAKNIKEMDFPMNVKYEIRDKLDTVIRARNKKKKTAGKGKKKK